MERTKKQIQDTLDKMERWDMFNHLSEDLRKKMRDSFRIDLELIAKFAIIDMMRKSNDFLRTEFENFNSENKTQ